MAYKINREVLLENEYKEIKLNKFQKKIKNRVGRKLFDIDIEYYQIPIDDKVHCDFDVKVKFRDCSNKNKEMDVNIRFSSEDMTIDMIEKVILKQWKAVGSPYYGK